MIVDASALVAIVFGEPEGRQLRQAIQSEQTVRMSAASYVEAGIVIDSGGDPVLSRQFDQLLAALNFEVVAVTPRQAEIARRAYADFGRGSGHRARLNFGDVLSYALAVDTGEELLFKGTDFGETDVGVHPTSATEPR